MDSLILKNIRFEAPHGYYEKERREGNRFEVDLIFTADLRQAGENDRLEDTIDYQRAAEIVRGVMEGPSRKLIETLARHIGDQLFATFPQAEQLQVAVRKINPPLPAKTAYSETRMSWQRSL